MICRLENFSCVFCAMIFRIMVLTVYRTNFSQQNKTNMLFVFKVLAEVIVAENVSKLMLPTVISLAQDAVANVRFNVAKTLQKIGPKIDSRWVYH